MLLEQIQLLLLHLLRPVCASACAADLLQLHYRQQFPALCCLHPAAAAVGAWGRAALPSSPCDYVVNQPTAPAAAAASPAASAAIGALQQAALP
jgi:hypothetical protein